MKRTCVSYLNCKEERRLLFNKGGYPILECKKCGYRFIEISNREDHLAKVYSDDYFFGGKDGYPNYLEQKDLLIEQGNRYVQLISRYTKPGKVLDIGSAAGFILKCFEESGWVCQGVEPNKTMAAYGREKLNLDIKNNSIETYQADEKFDLVNLIQVIGHVYDPDKTLQNIAGLLKEKGLVLVESWNRNSLAARIFGKRWHEYSPPSVMHWYSDKTLEQLFNCHGFKLISKGYPIKKIGLFHAFSFLEGKTSNGFYKGLFRSAKKITRRLALVNPFLDVKWYIFQQNPE